MTDPNLTATAAPDRAATTAALARLLAADGWDLAHDAEWPTGRGLLANRRDHRLVFCFDDRPVAELARLAHAIRAADAGRLATLPVLICADRARLAEWRRPEHAALWPCGLFVAAADLLATPPPDDRPRPIRTFAAEVLANEPVGGARAEHFKLRFRAPGLSDIVPGQFLMLATDREPPPAAPRALSADHLRGALELQPHSYLKRPFGVHRAYYPEWPPDYLRRIGLPERLAGLVKTVVPETFDLLCKVIPNGLGTHELRARQPGDRLAMTGPLGRRFDLRALRRDGIAEVHLVGGGCGVAPLIFMAQALRFTGYRVRAFVGVADLAMLVHRDPWAACHGGDPGEARIYVDDLLALGVGESDLGVSVDRPGGEAAFRERSRIAVHHGFVSDLYAQQLAAQPPTGPAVTFACGPTPMMQAVQRVTEARNIPLKVLLEKHMGCGIGVCLSCVCKTRDGAGGERQARVCTEGPIFDANEVIW